MRVTVVGSSGLIGGALVRALVDRGDTVRAVSRSGGAVVAGAQDVRWDPADGPPGPEVWGDTEVVVNLGGAPIAGRRWTAARKAQIRDSRVGPTTQLAAQIGGSDRPRTLVNASAVGYYGTAAGDAELTEAAAPGDDFLAHTCRAWEAATATAADRGGRVVLLRTGLVLAGDGGLLTPLARLSRLGVGGPVGGGRQWMPWIGLADHVSATLRAIDDVSLEGPLNLCAPHPVRQREFMSTLGRVLRRPSFAPTPGLVLRLAMGEMSTLALDGQRAVPRALITAGHRFTHPELEGALAAALGR